MTMVMPERHDKRVALLPFETTIANVRGTVPAKSMINDRTRVPMRFRAIAGREKLNGAFDGRHRRPAGQWITIFQ